MTKLLSNIDKIKSDFKNGQSYNSEHINLGIFFKASLAIFWVLFWLLEVQQHLYWANVHWIFPDYDTKGCPANMNVFWADFCLGLLFIVELIIAHALFFAAILYVDFFSIQKRYGFLKVGKTAFFIRYLLIVPLIDIVRNAVFLLIAMLVFNYGIKLPLAAFIIIVIVVTTLVVLADVKFSGQVQSITRGKMTPLSELD